MFNKEVIGLTLTKQVADNLFHNINGVKFSTDESFTATMRALLYDRVPEGEYVSLYRSNSSYATASIEGSGAVSCLRAFLRSTDILDGAGGILHIHSFDGSTDASTMSFEKVEEGIGGVLGSGYKQMGDLSTYLEQKGKFRAKVYINEDKRNTVIFVDHLDVKRWHMLASLIPRYFPWYFKDKPATDEEKALLVTLTKRYAPSFENAIENFAKRFDFRTQYIKDSLRGFETRFERKKLNKIREQQEEIQRRIRNLDSQFADYYRQLNDLGTTEVGLVEKIRRGGGDDCSELLDYFLCNKSLELVNVNGGRIEFIVKTCISNFDPDIFDSDIRNRESYFYRHYETGKKYGNPELTDDRIERLMREIFEKERLKLRVCAVYYLDFDAGDYGSKRNYSYPADILADHIPNQHLQVYACLGGNRTYIRRAMEEHDYIAAIENCVASAKSMNLTEHNTGTFFMVAICDKDVGRIIEMPDGTTKTPIDAVKWLEEQDAEKVAREEKADEQAY